MVNFDPVPTTDVVKQYSNSRTKQLTVPMSVARKHNIRKGDPYEVGTIDEKDVLFLLFKFNKKR